MYRQKLVPCFDASYALFTEFFVLNDGYDCTKIRSATHLRYWKIRFLRILVLYLINSADYYKAASIYFIIGQYAKLFCQIITELLILSTGIGTQNWCQNMGCIFLQLKCCHYSMVAVAYLLLASFALKCGDEADGTASPLAIPSVCTRIIYFWNKIPIYQAKVYTQKA